jgi:hypothetical protein
LELAELGRWAVAFFGQSPRGVQVGLEIADGENHLIRGGFDRWRIPNVMDGSIHPRDQNLPKVIRWTIENSPFPEARFLSKLVATRLAMISSSTGELPEKFRAVGTGLNLQSFTGTPEELGGATPGAELIRSILEDILSLGGKARVVFVEPTLPVYAGYDPFDPNSPTGEVLVHTGTSLDLEGTPSSSILTPDLDDIETVEFVFEPDRSDDGEDGR